MTDLRTAAQQALEALNVYASKAEHRRTHADDCAAEEAITALKAALAEEALQRFTDVNQEIEAALAEPVQEPVAWSFEARHIDTAFGPAVSIRHPGREHKYMRNVMPLYTTPPQRKPLTEKEIEALFEAELLALPPYPSATEELPVRLARAIERAHGITP